MTQIAGDSSSLEASDDLHTIKKKIAHTETWSPHGRLSNAIKTRLPLRPTTPPTFNQHREHVPVILLNPVVTVSGQPGSET